MNVPYENPIAIFDRNREELRWYLVDRFGLEKEWNVLLQARETEDPKEVAWAAHYAWDALPDNISIQVHPFSQLCNMAEQILVDIR